MAKESAVEFERKWRRVDSQSIHEDSLELPDEDLLRRLIEYLLEEHAEEISVLRGRISDLESRIKKLDGV